LLAGVSGFSLGVVSRILQGETAMSDAQTHPLGGSFVAPEPRAAVRYADELADRLFQSDPIYQRHLCQKGRGGLVDYLCACDDEPHDPIEVFWRLRWGGQFLYATTAPRRARESAAAFSEAGYVIEAGPTYQRGAGLRRPRRWWWPFGGTVVHYFVARKVLLVPPGETSERFTYHVRLMKRRPEDAEYVVCKEVPSLDSLVHRLSKRHPEVPVETIERRARKFTDKVFPTFLTREAGILRILQRDLPAAYRDRVPKVLAVEDDGRGFVRRLYETWMRNGGDPLPHLEFARQSADLLRALHDAARVIHLDLRLDNMVITPGGVGFIDFGSSVREGERLGDNPMLSSLFSELMRTSHIQVMLEKMTLTGHVTSHTLKSAMRKVDKAVDFFFLAVQFNSPHTNPDLADLIRFDPAAPEAKALAKMTEQILRPPEPSNPPYRSAADILRGVEEIARALGRS